MFPPSLSFSLVSTRPLHLHACWALTHPDPILRTAAARRSCGVSLLLRGPFSLSPLLLAFVRSCAAVCSLLCVLPPPSRICARARACLSKILVLSAETPGDGPQGTANTNQTRARRHGQSDKQNQPPPHTRTIAESSQFRSRARRSVKTTQPSPSALRSADLTPTTRSSHSPPFSPFPRTHSRMGLEWVQPNRIPFSLSRSYTHTTLRGWLKCTLVA